MTAYALPSGSSRNPTEKSRKAPTQFVEEAKNIEVNLMSPASEDKHCLSQALAYLALFSGACALAFRPDWFDRPAARAINKLTTHGQFAGECAFTLSYPTVQAVIVVSLLWWCWFSGITASKRAQLLGGIAAAVVAGLIAHVLHEVIATSPRPIVDAPLGFQASKVLGDPESLKAMFQPGSHRFPSERATMFAGLAIAILPVQRKIGLIALACTMLAEMARVYLGLHYLGDIVGSVSLAAAIVWLAQMSWVTNLSLYVVNRGAAAPATFYMCAFCVTYQLANSFLEIRELMAHLLR